MNSFIFELKNIAFLRFSDDSEYKDIISPYSRLYLINEGKGHVIMGNQTLHLETGYLYLIPSFEHCSYFFQQNLEHIYIHFKALTENGMSIYNQISFQHKIKATDLNTMLFYRLLEINPGLELPHHDPKIYQTKPWMDKKADYKIPGHKLESEAIIQQLISVFISGYSPINTSLNLRYRLQEVLSYIHSNLHKDIRITQLAEISCLSKDHFTRIFKQMFGISPMEFIMSKRIEKSQYLLLTTNWPTARIIEETNFKNPPYFSRMFKKYTSHTPGEYRRKGFRGV